MHTSNFEPQSVRTFLYIAILLSSLMSFGQRKYIYGNISDTTSTPLQDVIIRNTTARSITSTNQEGAFKIPAIVGDSLAISFIGFRTIRVEVDEGWMEEETRVFQLTAMTTFLDEVTVTKFPEYSQFKDQILSTTPNDTSFQVFGISKVVITKEDRLNASLKSRGPISLMHNAFSKRAKEQKKMRKLIQTQQVSDNARSNFSRDWVAELTQLTGDKLTSFIAFCNFTETYLATTPSYIIHEDMMAMLPKFLDEYQGKG